MLAPAQKLDRSTGSWPGGAAQLMGAHFIQTLSPSFLLRRGTQHAKTNDRVSGVGRGNQPRRHRFRDERGDDPVVARHGRRQR